MSLATRALEITFRRANSSDAAAAIRLFCDVDAAYGTHPDSKSHTGYCFGLGDTENGMFFSRTVKQQNVTLSSTEAENAAAVEATKEVVWFRQFAGARIPPVEANSSVRGQRLNDITHWLRTTVGIIKE
jgi:hypothetical protein